MTKIKHIESMRISYTGATEKGLNGKIKKWNLSITFSLIMTVVVILYWLGE